MLAHDVTLLSLAVMFVAFAVNIGLHEAAHAVVARRAGCRVQRVAVGIGPLLLTARIGGADVFLRAIPLAGHVLYESAHASRATKVRVSLAGPLATLGLAAALVALGEPISAPAARSLLVLGTLGLIRVVPGSDAAHAWAALRGAQTTGARGR